MNYIDAIKKTFDLLDIKNATVIDDDLNFKDQNKETIYKILNGHYDDEDFSIQDLLVELNLELEDVITDLDDDKFSNELYLKLKGRFPKLFVSKIDNLLSVLGEIFGENLILKDKATSSIDKETIVFLDYHLEGSPLESHELTQILSKHDKETPLLIVFISSNEEFYLGNEEKSFKMENLSERNKYFRGLRNQQLSSDYKNSLYEYINKGKLNKIESVQKALYEISQNLYGGQRFFNLLSQIEGVLIESSEEVLGKFHLLNSRSIQELLVEKVALEGESESTFLLNWISRNISKSITKNYSLTHTIHSTLEEIGQWSTPFNELHEDVALKEIVLDEMWDSTVNERHLPVEFGDVFEIIYNNEVFKALLVTQSCTLAVRGDGTRGGNLATLVLEEKKKKKGDSLAIIEDWSGQRLVFDLNTTINIPFEVLDLATLDSNGRAKLRCDEQSHLPKEALWSKGYTKMMNKLISKLIQELDSETRLFQFGYMWLPVSYVDKNFEFPIERKSRLDTYYTLYVLQKLQSWSGRIGLPLDVKFMTDYIRKNVNIDINGISNEVEVYIKQSSNENIKDIAISVDLLEKLLTDVYIDNIKFIEELKEIFKSPELLKYNYSSGERLVSIAKSSDAITLLGKHNIHISVLEEELLIRIRVGEFTKCLFNGNDISDLISNFQIDQRGELRYHIQTALLEKLDLTSRIPHYDKRITEISDGINIFKMTSSFPFFKHDFRGDKLEIIYEGEAAASIE